MPNDDTSSCLPPSDACPNTSLADQLKALGHPARLQIIQRLKALETPCCGEVCDCLPLAQSTVSQHLDVLKKAGLVISRQVGNRSCFSLNHQAIRSVSEAVAAISAAAGDAATSE